MYKFLRFLIPLILIQISCSDKPVLNSVYNVRLTGEIPADPLISQVSSGRVSVDGPGLVQALDSTFEIDAAAGMLTVDMAVQPGPDREFRVFLASEEGSVFFGGLTIGSVPENQAIHIGFILDQTGFSSASSVLVFRDQYPWDSHALDSTLISQGLTTGIGNDQYHIYPSSEMPFAELRPGIDLVIISNDQPQSFYDNYVVNRERIEQFVEDGGSLLWCACDMGWNYGSISEAGLELPRQVEIGYSLDMSNLVSDHQLRLVGDFPDTLRGNYASQEIFSGLPGDAIVYLTDSRGNATLVGFGMGKGTVIISGQPLEYNYDRRESYNIGDLLPRLIRFLLGIGTGGSLSLLPGFETFDSENEWNGNSTRIATEGTSRQ